MNQKYYAVYTVKKTFSKKELGSNNILPLHITKYNRISESLKK